VRSLFAEKEVTSSRLIDDYEYTTMLVRRSAHSNKRI